MNSNSRKSEQFIIDFISFMFIRCNSSNPCFSISNTHPYPRPYPLEFSRTHNYATSNYDNGRFVPKTQNHTCTHTYTYLDRKNDGVLRTRIVICIYNISQFHFHYVLVGERKRTRKRRRRRRRKKHANAKMLNGIVQWRAENGTSIHE